MEGFKPLYYIL